MRLYVLLLRGHGRSAGYESTAGSSRSIRVRRGRIDLSGPGEASKAALCPPFLRSVQGVMLIAASSSALHLSSIGFLWIDRHSCLPLSLMTAYVLEERL